MVDNIVVNWYLIPTQLLIAIGYQAIKIENKELKRQKCTKTKKNEKKCSDHDLQSLQSQSSGTVKYKIQLH